MAHDLGKLGQVTHGLGVAQVAHGPGSQVAWLMVQGILGRRLMVQGCQVQVGPQPHCGQTNSCENITFPHTTYIVDKTHKKSIVHREFLGPTIGGWLYDNVGFAWCMTGCGGFNLVMVSTEVQNCLSNAFKTLID